MISQNKCYIIPSLFIIVYSLTNQTHFQNELYNELRIEYTRMLHSVCYLVLCIELAG